MEEGEGGINWEIRSDKYTIPCVKQIASGNQLDSTELSSVLCVDLEGWVVGCEWVGGDFRGKEYLCTYS